MMKPEELFSRLALAEIERQVATGDGAGLRYAAQAWRNAAAREPTCSDGQPSPVAICDEDRAQKFDQWARDAGRAK